MCEFSELYKCAPADALQERIMQAGGRVVQLQGPRVQGLLAVSRAIGDHSLRPYVTACPEVTHVGRRHGDELLLLASDGLWDMMSCQVGGQVQRPAGLVWAWACHGMPGGTVCWRGQVRC
jgi:hypothetical protein